MLKGFMNEFKKFAMRGNVIDMAVGIIIGAAFGKIVDSLVKDIIMPPIGLLLGKVDFTNLYVVLKEGVTAAPYASLDAAQNAGLSPWSDRITVYAADFVQSYGPYTRPLYDHILSNPPYFVQSLLPPDRRREHARHTGSLDYEALFEGAAVLLRPGGRLSLIAPADLEEHLAFVGLLHGFYPVRYTYVSGIAGRAPKRLLSEWGRERLPLETDALAVERRGEGYTPEYVALTRDFYLKM